MRVLHVASEVAPWAQSGGLADVVAALPTAIHAAEPAIQTAVIANLASSAEGSFAVASASVHSARSNFALVGHFNVLCPSCLKAVSGSYNSELHAGAAG